MHRSRKFHDTQTDRQTDNIETASELHIARKCARLCAECERLCVSRRVCACVCVFAYCERRGLLYIQCVLQVCREMQSRDASIEEKFPNIKQSHTFIYYYMVVSCCQKRRIVCCTVVLPNHACSRLVVVVGMRMKSIVARFMGVLSSFRKFCFAPNVHLPHNGMFDAFIPCAGR